MATTITAKQCQTMTNRCRYNYIFYWYYQSTKDDIACTAQQCMTKKYCATMTEQRLDANTTSSSIDISNQLMMMLACALTGRALKCKTYQTL